MGKAELRRGESPGPSRLILSHQNGLLLSQNGKKAWRSKQLAPDPLPSINAALGLVNLCGKSYRTPEQKQTKIR